MKRNEKSLFLLLLVVALTLSMFAGCGSSKQENVIPSLDLSTAKDMIERLELIKENTVRITNTVSKGTIVGTGFYMGNGYLVTNSHVVDMEGSITVEFADGTTSNAALFANDIASDIALLTTDKRNAVALETEKDADVQVSDTLYAIGYGLALKGEASVTKGICSASREAKKIKYIQTDAAVNGGFSGGPLVNEEGKVVGLITFADSSATISMAIAEESFTDIVSDLLSDPQVSYVEGTRPENALSGMLKEVGVHVDHLHEEGCSWSDKNQVEKITFSSKTMKLAPDEQKVLEVKVTPTASLAETLVWTTSDKTVAEFSGGHVVAKGKGECTITATAPNGVSASCKVVVSPKLVDSGKCGENVKWSYYADGSLVFSGSGDMKEYYKTYYYAPANVLIPWYSYSPRVKEIVVQDGITSICSFAFLDCRRCEKITISDSVKKIGHCAFEHFADLDGIVLSKNVVELGGYVFHSCQFDVFYEGTKEELDAIKNIVPTNYEDYKDEDFSYLFDGIPEEDWDTIEVPTHDPITDWDVEFSGKVLCYSKTQQEGCWRYVDNVPTPW